MQVQAHNNFYENQIKLKLQIVFFIHRYILFVYSFVLNIWVYSNYYPSKNTFKNLLNMQVSLKFYPL